MQYREVLNECKNCPKCCSQTLDRYMKKYGKTAMENAPRIEKPSYEYPTLKRRLPK